MGNRTVSSFLFLTAMTVAIFMPQAFATEKANVARAQFTTEVMEREPADRVLVLNNEKRKILFFTELKHLQGRKIIHRWEYKGNVVSSVPFEVKGPRWRVYSARDLQPDQLGIWTVVVTDEEGWPLKAAIFEYVDKTAGASEIVLPPIGAK